MSELTRLSIVEAGAAFRAGTLTATALAQAQLARIEALNPKIRAFVAITPELALTAAAQADADFAAGIDHGPMQGIGFAIKDMIDLEGQLTTCGSHQQPTTPAIQDAAVVSRLRAVGAVPLGKVVTYEYALVGPSFDGPQPPAVNPWNIDHITGGSSSGSAAAVASGMVRCAIGTDTGGSIRSPAAYCGVVGLKPTKGAIALHGVFPLSPDLDHVGSIAATVADVAEMANAMGLDATSRLGLAVRGLKIGYARDWFAYDPATAAAVLVAMDRAMSYLSLIGCQVQLVSLPNYAEIEALGVKLLQYQAFAIHKETLHSGKYGQQAIETLLSGQHITAYDFATAQSAAKSLHAEFTNILAPFDAIATANVLSTAPPFSAFVANRAVWTPMRTVPFNITGHPALALPIGFSDGLPIGMQLFGPDNSEAVLCQIGDAFERATDHALQRPNL